MFPDDVEVESTPLLPTGFEILLFGIFAFVAVVFVAVIVLAVVRYRVATRLARQAGLTRREAAGVAWASQNGWEAAHLASQLGGTTPQTSGGASAEARLGELSGLRDKGLVTSEEYDAKRKAILDSL